MSPSLHWLLWACLRVGAIVLTWCVLVPALVAVTAVTNLRPVFHGLLEILAYAADATIDLWRGIGEDWRSRGQQWGGRA